MPIWTVLNSTLSFNSASMQKFLRVALTLFICSVFVNSGLAQNSQPPNRAIPLDQRALSGLDLAPVSNPSQPDRRLFQKKLLGGNDISVYIVSSETASAVQTDYGIDEFIFLINGRARINPDQGEEVFFTPGDFFMVPRGFDGEWETQGGTEFYHELSVITSRRAEVVDSTLQLPMIIDKNKLAGIDLTPSEAKPGVEFYRDEIYRGTELNIDLEAIESGIYEMEDGQEQLVYVIAGSVDVINSDGESQSFYSGDFFVLPQGFTGSLDCEGHHLFRSLRVTKGF